MCLRVKSLVSGGLQPVHGSDFIVCDRSAAVAACASTSGGEADAKNAWEISCVYIVGRRSIAKASCASTLALAVTCTARFALAMHLQEVAQGFWHVVDGSVSLICAGIEEVSAVVTGGFSRGLSCLLRHASRSSGALHSQSEYFPLVMLGCARTCTECGQAPEQVDKGAPSAGAAASEGQPPPPPAEPPGSATS